MINFMHELIKELIRKTLFLLAIVALVTFLIISFYSKDNTTVSKRTMPERVYYGNMRLDHQPFAIQFYIQRIDELKRKLNVHTWSVQIFFIERNLHEQSNMATEAKTVLDEFEKKYYFKITPSVIDEFIKRDKEMWSQVCQDEYMWDCERWLDLKKEHSQIIYEFMKLKPLYENMPK